MDSSPRTTENSVSSIASAGERHRCNITWRMTATKSNKRNGLLKLEENQGNVENGVVDTNILADQEIFTIVTRR